VQFPFPDRFFEVIPEIQRDVAAAIPGRCPAEEVNPARFRRQKKTAEPKPEQPSFLLVMATETG